MTLKDGQKYYGKVMIKNKLKEKLNPALHYLIEYSYANMYKELSKNIYEMILNNFIKENIDICCSWYCGTDYELLDKMGYKCHYYDMDKVVTEVNSHITKNIHTVDVVFDDVKFQKNNIIVNKFCENTFPLGKLFNGDFILAGSDSNHLSNINKISSCETLIKQNNLSTVYETRTFFNRYNFYLVAGCNI